MIASTRAREVTTFVHNGNDDDVIINYITVRWPWRSRVTAVVITVIESLLTPVIFTLVKLNPHSSNSHFSGSHVESLLTPVVFTSSLQWFSRARVTLAARAKRMAPAPEPRLITGLKYACAH